MIKKRLDILCKEKKITAKKLCEDIGISQQTYNKWGNGTEIKERNLIKIAEYFNCTTDYILGRTDEKDIKINKNYSQYNQNGNNNQHFENNLEPLEMELLNSFRKYSKKEQLKLLSKMEEEK
mgnify:FL=1